MSSSEKAIEKDQVVEIINSVLDKAAHSDIPYESIFDDIRNLKKVIDEARAELGAVGGADVKGEFIPKATDELDAVVEATADATGKIMDACDEIQTIADAAGGDVSAKVMEEVTKVYEACSFQDITGQRITKVVNTLKKIEEKVGAMVGVIGGMEEEDRKETQDDGDPLLNGPQLKGQGVSQEEIDKMLEDLF